MLPGSVSTESVVRPVSPTCRTDSDRVRVRRRRGGADVYTDQSGGRSSFETSRPISGFGVGLKLPPGWVWARRQTGREGRDHRQCLELRTAERGLPWTEDRQRNARGQHPDRARGLRPAAWPRRLRELEGRGAPNLDRSIQPRRTLFGQAGALAARWLVIDGRAVHLLVGFGTTNPSDAMFDEANRVLATLHRLEGNTEPRTARC
jgi:hypothetical protein